MATIDLDDNSGKRLIQNQSCVQLQAEAIFLPRLFINYTVRAVYRFTIAIEQDLIMTS
jgi:hypothetical protein